MAIAFRSANTASNGSTGTIVINNPAGLADGDLVITAIALFDDTLFMDTLSGWTAVPGCNNLAAGSGSDVRVQSFYKVAASEPASWTWTVNTSASRAKAVIAAAYTGTDTSNPIDVSNGQANAASASVVAPSVDPATIGWLVFVGGSAGAGTFTAPGTMTERADVNNSGSSPSITLCDEALTVDTATGTRTGTCTVANRNVGQNIVLREAGQPITLTANSIAVATGAQSATVVSGDVTATAGSIVILVTAHEASATAVGVTTLEPNSINIAVAAQPATVVSEFVAVAGSTPITVGINATVEQLYAEAFPITVTAWAHPATVSSPPALTVTAGTGAVVLAAQPATVHRTVPATSATVVVQAQTAQIRIEFEDKYPVSVSYQERAAVDYREGRR